MGHFMSDEERMDFDVVIVGAGPAGLTAAIRLAQKKPELSIAILEKGAQVGAHILSGAVFNPSALNELLPDWQQQNAPITTAVSDDKLYFLTKNKRYRLPQPPMQHNKGNFIISLGELCQWLAEQAESLGVNIFPGFPASEIIYNDDKSRVLGVKTGAMGLDEQGKPGEMYQPGLIIGAKHIFIAEGCRGSLAEQLLRHFKLRNETKPQHYGIGIKEKWRIGSDQHQLGRVEHTIGWPIPANTYGGGFIYHGSDETISLGLIIGLHAPDPSLDPFMLLQRFKTHPQIAPLLQSGECIGYGARAINEGGWQSIPECHFPGGTLIGCSAGFVNVGEIKGIHHAMHSAMIAADAYLEDATSEVTMRIKQSATGKALYRGRNLYPAFKWGRTAGVVLSGIDQFVFRGKAPWTFSAPIADHLKLNACANPQIKQQKLSHPLMKRLLDQLALTHVDHREHQPCHLQLKDPKTPMAINWPKYGGPEQYYCPAGVYEYVTTDGKQRLQINSQNCIHCKTCDIKDPTQNIRWVPPEGGGGPNYISM